MLTLFNLWKIASSSGWSIPISLGIVLLLGGIVWLIIKGIRPKARPSAVGMIAAGVTAVLLLVQLIPALAAYTLKSTVDDANNFANTLMSSKLTGGGAFSEQSQEYVNILAEQAHSYIDGFIKTALLIALAEACIGISIVVFTLEEGGRVSSRRGRGTPVRNNKSTHNISRNGKSHFNRSRRHRL